MTTPKSVAATANLEVNTTSTNVTKLWGYVSLTPSCDFQPPSVDFVIGLDISASMRGANFDMARKIASHLVAQLDEKHTISLVAFNHETEFVFHYLTCNPENKKLIQTQLDTVSPYGPTNIISALNGIGSRIDRRRQETSGKQPHRGLTSVFFITDGGRSSWDAFVGKPELVGKLPHIKNCVFNVFGIGNDAESKTLYEVSRHFKGAYHFIENESSIVPTVDACVSDVLNVQLQSVKLTMRANSGCRIVTIVTPYPTTEEIAAKTYSLDLGTLSRNGTTSILFQLSLRGLDTSHASHPLMSAEVGYLLPDESPETVITNLTVLRLKEVPIHGTIHASVQYHTDRYAMVEAMRGVMLQSDIQKSNGILSAAIEKISNPLMIADLRACLADPLRKRKHMACSFCSAYAMENFLELKRRIFAPPSTYVAFEF